MTFERKLQREIEMQAWEHEKSHSLILHWHWQSETKRSHFNPSPIYAPGERSIAMIEESIWLETHYPLEDFQNHQNELIRLYLEFQS